MTTPCSTTMPDVTLYQNRAHCSNVGQPAYRIHASNGPSFFCRGALPASSLERSLPAPWLGTNIPEDIPLPVQAGNKHRTAMLFARWLAIRDHGWLIPY